MKPKHKAAKTKILPSLRGVRAHRTASGHWFGTCGTGSPLVLLPGFGADHTAWAPVVPALARHFRVVLVDPPGVGHGRELSADDRFDALATPLFDVLDMLGVETARLLGASMGGMIAMDFAARAPNRVSHLCTVCSMAKVEPHARAQVGERMVLLENEGPDVFATRMIADLVRPAYRARHPKVVDAVAHAYALALPRVAAVQRSARLLVDADLRADLPRIRAETLIVHGADDVFVSREAARTLADAIPDATLWVLEHVGHHALLEARDELLDEVIAFFRGPVGGDSP